MFDEASKQLRWFLLPSEAADCFKGNQSQNATKLPFCPPNLREQLGLSLFSERQIDDEVTVTDMLDNNIKAALHVHKERSTGGDGGGFENESDEGIYKEDLYVEKKLAEDTFDAREKVVFDELKNETPFSEGIQKCLNVGFDSSGVSAKTRDQTESNEAGPKSIENNLEIEKEVCPIEIDSKSKTDRNAEATQGTGVGSCQANVCAKSPDSKHLLTRCAGIKCDGKGCENSNLCRKRHAECTEDNQVCEMAKKRARDEKGIEGGKDADKNVVNDKKQTGRQSKKKKEGTRWFSPPKTIFTPYLKVSKIISFHEVHVLINSVYVISKCFLH